MVKRYTLVLCLGWISLCTHAQAWKEDYDQAEKFYHDGNYTKAISFGEASLKKYQEAGAADTGEIAILKLLSAAYYSKEQFAKGVTYIDREILLLAKQKDSTYCTALMHKAEFQKQLNRHDLALTALQECHQLLARHHKNKNKKLLECDLQIAIEYYLNNDFAKANEWFKTSLHQAESRKFFSAATIEAAYFYGLLNLQTNKSQEALKNFSKAIYWCEAGQRTKTPEYALILNGLGTAQNVNHSFGEAEKNFQSAQAVCENVEGCKDYYNEVLACRAVNLQQLGKFSDAEMVVKKILPNHSTKLPPLPTLDSARAYQASKDYERSEALYQKALGHFQSDDKESLMAYAEINYNLSLMYLEKGELPTALTQFSETRELIEKLYGYYHRKYVNVLNAMGFTFIRMESWVEAEASFRQSFQIMSRMPGALDPENIAALEGMAEVERGKGSTAKADSITSVAGKARFALLKQVPLHPPAYP